MVTSPESWFSVRCFFRYEDTYEERITLWAADDFDSAIAFAEAEAREYAAIVGNEYLDSAQAFHLSEADLQPGAELFSLIRQSELEPADYVNTFFDTGTEFQQLGN